MDQALDVKLSVVFHSLAVFREDVPLSLNTEYKHTHKTDINSFKSLRLSPVIC